MFNTLKQLQNAFGAELPKFMNLIRKTLFFAVRYCRKNASISLDDADVVSILQCLTAEGADKVYGDKEVCYY